MSAAGEGDLLWTPDASRIARSNVARYLEWLQQSRGTSFATYDELWRWTVSDIEAFWASLWDYIGVQSDGSYASVVDSLEMKPGNRWFTGSRVNFAEHVLRAVRPSQPAIHFLAESSPLTCITGGELAARVRILGTQLRAMGVAPGDRVCALMPNSPATVVAMLATISIGAVWSVAAPEFGAQSILDRFGQVEPKVLFVVDGYRYGGKVYDRRDMIPDIVGRLPTIQRVVYVRNLYPQDLNAPVDCLHYDQLLTGDDPGAASYRFERVPSDHPLWVVFSSGTTGLPKAIVHSHVGALMGMFCLTHFTMDLKPGDVGFFYTTTGWIMFNVMVAMLMNGASVVLYDGDPVYPDADVLWNMAEKAGATHFGASPTYIEMLQRSGIEPGKRYDLAKLESLTVSGAPCQPEAIAWCYRHVKRDLWVNSPSGGTETSYAFVGGVPTLPVYAGEIQARCLGMAVEAWNESGNPVTDEPGELVCVKPFPSMPLYFLNDDDDERYRETYFETYPGVWRHGDQLKINERGGCFIYGRSDSTLNRRGVRIGTAEIYRVVERIDEVSDAVVVCVNTARARDLMVLFVALKPGAALDDALERKIKGSLKRAYSPRHVPDRILQIEQVPYTLTGKKMEVPVRKVLSGMPIEKAASKDSMRNPAALGAFVRWAVDLEGGGLTSA